MFNPAAKTLTFTRHFLKWLVVALGVGLMVGNASSLFLFVLGRVTDIRLTHPSFVYALPAVGFLVALAYHSWGKDLEGGSNLLLDEIHEPKKILPLKMAPFILVATWLSHLVGASVGREGTGVQMGGALADQFSRWFGFTKNDRRLVLMAGMSAGFASVFATPLAGAVFGLEVLSVGILKTEGIFPCFVAALTAAFMRSVWNLPEARFWAGSAPLIHFSWLAIALLSGAVFGLASRCFVKAEHSIATFFKKNISCPPLRPFFGGCLVLFLVMIFKDRYLGLGTPVVQEAFLTSAPLKDFLGKLFFTALCLGSGFKGGEVTPLFFMGATLGSFLSFFLPLSTPLLASIGFVSVFAGAANVPITCCILSLEIFPPEVALYASLACVVSSIFSGHTGIYAAQRVAHSKLGRNSL